jgi:succinate dehydrogenase / fumarate reductase iron-sulfur subunit
MILKVFRYDPGSGEQRYDRFPLTLRAGMTVLEALFLVASEQDDSLAFRYSCRGAVCGTCAVLVNHVPRLAYRTRLEPLLRGEDRLALASHPGLERGEPYSPDEEVLVEPLPNMPLIKDLVVDLEGFFSKYRTISPVFRPGGELPGKEQLMHPSAVRELETYTNCILCASCYAACPVNAADDEYIGPAALAKLYRFAIDPREGDHASRFASADTPHGWWACRFFTNCAKVCPKGVTPNVAIGKARRALKGHEEDFHDEEHFPGADPDLPGE